MRENDFQKRAKKAQEAIIKLQEKYEIILYATNQVMENDEVRPVIKYLDNKKKGDIVK